MVVGCVKAIIGWEPTSSLGSPNIGIAYLTLLGKHLFIGLCGLAELTKQADKKVLSNMVAIQCGGGSWTRALNHLPGHVIVHDLSQYSTFRGTYDGVLPRLDESYDTTFDSLIGEFKTLWSHLTDREGDSDRKLVSLQGWAAPVVCTPSCLPNVGRPCARPLSLG